MAIVKQEQYECEVAIFAHRHEASAVKWRQWLLAYQADLNSKWPDATGDDLMKLQGEAKLIQRQLKMLEKGPTIKQEAVQ